MHCVLIGVRCVCLFVVVCAMRFVVIGLLVLGRCMVFDGRCWLLRVPLCSLCVVCCLFLSIVLSCWLRAVFVMFVCDWLHVVCWLCVGVCCLLCCLVCSSCVDHCVLCVANWRSVCVVACCACCLLVVASCS